MKRLLFLILLPFLCAFTVTATPPAVVIQSESVAIHVKADGSVERNVSITMKLNTFQALRTVGEWFYSYNPKLEQVEILVLQMDTILLIVMIFLRLEQLIFNLPLQISILIQLQLRLH